MKVYVVVKADSYDEYDIDILGIFKNEKDAERCFIDFILGQYYYEAKTVEDLTNEEKEGIKNWDYWNDSYRLIISEEEIQ